MPMTLGNLGPTQIETLATNIAGGKTLPTEIVVQITEKSDGVPLFVEEMTKAILESGDLRDAGTHYELTGSLEAVTVPITLHDSLMARLDRLDTAKSLAQLGAVIGRQFPYELVQALAPLDETILQRELRRLVDAGLLYQRGLPPRATYLFKHALIQDVAYESLLRQRRQALHGDIAQAIETIESDHLEEQVGLLAYHYARSTQQDKAIAYALSAGDKAAGLYANAEATTYFEQALAMAQSLSDTPDVQGMQIDAILKLAAVDEGQNIERDRQHLEQARHLAEALRDEPRLARVLYWQGRIHYAGGDLRTAITYAEQSLAIADRLGDETLAAPPVNLLGRSAFMLSDFARASQLLARSTEQMHQIGNVSEEATAAALAGMAFGCLGEFRQALAFGDRGLRLAQEQQNPFAVAAAYQYRAIIHDQRGAWSQMISDCEAARRVAERAGDLFRIYLVKMFEGQAHTMAGQAKQGRVHLEESVALAAQFGTTFGLSWGKANLAACLLALDDYQSARHVCHEAIELAEATGHTFSQALAHRLLAETLAILTPADVQAAEDAILEAIRLQQEMDNNPELARSFVIYARLLRGWRQVDKATEYLNRALDLFQRLDMGWDLARAVAVFDTLA